MHFNHFLMLSFWFEKLRGNVWGFLSLEVWGDGLSRLISWGLRCWFGWGNFWRYKGEKLTFLSKNDFCWYFGKPRGFLKLCLLKNEKLQKFSKTVINFFYNFSTKLKIFNQSLSFRSKIHQKDLLFFTNCLIFQSKIFEFLLKKFENLRQNFNNFQQFQNLWSNLLFFFSSILNCTSQTN